MSDTEDRRLLADELRNDGWPEMAELIQAGNEDEFNKIMWVNLAVRAIAKARQQEREAAVACLKAEAKQQSAAEADDDWEKGGQVAPSEFAWELANAIERGDHLKGTSE